MRRPKRRHVVGAVLAALVGGVGALFVAQSAPPPVGTIYTIPADVPADCSADAQPGLAAFIAAASDHSVIVFPSGSCYRLDSPLGIFERTQLDLEGAGATLQSGVTAPDCTGPGVRGHVLNLGSDTDVTVYGFTVIGTNPVPGHFDAAHYCQHGLNVNNGTRINIRAVTVSNVFGDCFYFGGGPDPGVSFATVTDSSCTGPGREGASIVDGDHVEFIANAFTNFRNGITTDKNTTADHAAYLHVIANTFAQGKGVTVNLKGGASSSNAVIVDNRCGGPVCTVVVSGPGGTSDLIANTLILGNKGADGQRAGTWQVSLGGTTNVVVSDNASDCTPPPNGGDQGIRFGGTTDTTTVTHNRWINCKEAFYTGGSVQTNLILYGDLMK